MTYTLNHLSGSTDGQPIAVTGTTTGASVTVHTAVAGTDIDEIYIFANNISSAAVDLTIEFGGTTTPDKIVRTIPAKTSKLVVEGAILQNSKVVKAFASVADVVNLYGKVGTTA